MFRQSAIVTALLAAYAIPVFADEPATSVDEPAQATVTVTGDVIGKSDYQPLVSNVGAKTAQALRDIPQSVNVVDRALMDAQGAASLADALRNVPGITIGGAEGGQIGNNINLRGFTARTDIYIDGFRDRGQYYRDLFDLEQVEVLQGPSSMLFGRGSTGGVINQQTKQARLNGFTEVSATAGSDGRVRSTLDTDVALSDTAALRVNAFGQDLQTTRDVMQNRDFGVAPTVTFGIGQPTTVTVSALLQHNDDMPDYGVQALNGVPVTAGRDTFYGLRTDHTVQDIAMLNATVLHHVDDNWSLRNQVQLNHYTTDAVETAAHALSTSASVAGLLALPAFGQVNPAGLWVELQSHDRQIIDSSIDNQTDLIGHFATGPLRHELIAGLEIGRDTYENQTILRTGSGMPAGYVGFVALQAPDPAPPATLTTTRANVANASADSVGAYVNDTVSLDEHWKIVGGVRHDSFNAHLTNSLSLPATATQDTGFTSVRGGIIYQPDQAQSWYLSYGTSFDPLLEQMTLTNGQQNLPPTSTRSGEIGAKLDFADDALSLTAALFREQQDNVYSQSNGEYTAAGNWLIKGASLGLIGRLAHDWQVSAGAMHLDARVEGTSDGTAGSIPANVPGNTFNVWSTWTPARNWELGGGAFYVGQRFVADSGRSSTLPQGNIDRVAVPGYTRLDATLAWHQPHYDLRLNVLNLTDRFYYDALIPSDGGRAVPGIGRTVLVTGNWRF